MGLIEHLVTFSGNTLEQTLASQQLHPCFVLTLAGAIYFNYGNLTITGSEIRRGGLTGNEGKE
ncbi:MAG: hypothetical protein ABJZ69_10965 [Hyphomicrobiales bacterium]